MKKILTYLLFSLIIPVGAAVLFYLHFMSDTTDIDPNMHYLLRPSGEQNDILFIGNSRVLNLVDPRITESRTGHKAYNLGLEGGSTVYFNMVYRAYLQRHPKPKYIMMNVDYRCFDTEQQVFNFPDYFPYLRDSMVAACLAPYYAGYQCSITQLYYRMKRINSKPDPSKISNLRGLFSFAQASSLPLVDTLRGFHPFDMKWEGQAHVVSAYDAVYSARGIEMLRSIIQDARQQDIRVIMICAPFYKDYHRVVRNAGTAQDTILHIAGEMHVPYWDYSDIALSDTTAYFYNINHLNARGAAIYSRMLAGDLRRYLADSSYVPDIQSRKAHFTNP